MGRYRNVRDSGYARGGETVQDGDPDLERGDLRFEVPRPAALANRSDSVRSCCDMARAVMEAAASLLQISVRTSHPT